MGPPTKCTQLLCAHIAELLLNMCAYKSAAQCALSDLLSYEHGSTGRVCVVRCSLYRGLQFVEKKRRAKPKCWVRPFLKRREEETERFLEEMKIDPLSGFKKFSRISCEDLEFLINAIGPLIAKQDTNFRKSVSVLIRLWITLRYLGTGDSFAVSQSTGCVSMAWINSRIFSFVHSIVRAYTRASPPVPVARLGARTPSKLYVRAGPPKIWVRAHVRICARTFLKCSRTICGSSLVSFHRHKHLFCTVCSTVPHCAAHRWNGTYMW